MHERQFRFQRGFGRHLTRGQRYLPFDFAANSEMMGSRMTTISVTLENGTSETSLTVQALRIVEFSKCLGFKDMDDGSTLFFIRDPFGDEVLEQLRSAGFRAAKVDPTRG